MMKLTTSGRWPVPVLAVCLLLLAGVAPAQVSQQAQSNQPSIDPAVAALETQIEILARQLEKVQQELTNLKHEQLKTKQAAALEHLKQAAHTEAFKDAGEDEIDTSTKFIGGTRSQAQLNPEISVVGNLLFVGSDHRHEEFQARHFELDIRSALDPFTTFHLVLGWHGGGRDSTFGHEEYADHEDENDHSSVGVGEAYVTWLHLPGATSLTVGKKRSQFGVLNRWHLHSLDQGDQPWVLKESFGDHGLSGVGLSLDWQMPRLWADANELTLEVFNGDNEVAFAGSDWRDPSFLARLKSYWDVGDDAYLEVGLNGLHGKADEDGERRHDFYAVDLTYNWYPAGREHYRDVTLRGMLLRSELEREDFEDRDAIGGFLYGQTRFATSWIAGLRFDYVEDQREDDHKGWGLTPYLTFWQSHFVRLRGQYSYRDDTLFGTDNSFLLQLTVAAGPHKHENY